MEIPMVELGNNYEELGRRVRSDSRGDLMPQSAEPDEDSSDGDEENGLIRFDRIRPEIAMTKLQKCYFELRAIAALDGIVPLLALGGSGVLGLYSIHLHEGSGKNKDIIEFTNNVISLAYMLHIAISLLMSLRLWKKIFKKMAVSSCLLGYHIVSIFLLGLWLYVLVATADTLMEENGDIEDHNATAVLAQVALFIGMRFPVGMVMERNRMILKYIE